MSLEDKMRKARPQDIAAHYGYKLDEEKKRSQNEGRST